MNWNTGSLEEQGGRWEDQRDIKNLMGIYVNHIIMNMEAEIFDALWSSRDDVCYGDNDGWYVGPDAVRGYYQAVRARNALVAELLQRKFPQEIGQRTAEENFGIGTFRDFPVACPVIEVAGDGQTAKGLWSCLGAHNEVGGAGPVANWTWGYFAADFRREDQGWKIWHLLYVNDVDCICGQSWGKPQQPYPDLPEFADVKAFRYPDYTVARQVREYYRPDRPLTLTPEIPVPYETFADTFSYGIGEEA